MLFSTFLLSALVWFPAGVIAVLVFQGGEMRGRLEQHANDLRRAWNEADAAISRLVRLKVQREEEQFDFETRYANLALALDREAHRNHTVETRRVEAWKALDSALRELHADPSPKCRTCGDSIKVDDQCFVCGLHDWPSDQPIAQA